MQIFETERLILREIDSAADAEFILELLNSPGFLKYIGDRGVRSAGQSRDFIDNRLRKSYADHGYGLYVVELKDGGQAAGICGFVKRDELPGPDLGFALLPDFENKGYAYESAAAVLNYGRTALGFTRVLAITSRDNDRSGKLLEKLGFGFDGETNFRSGETLKLFSSEPR